jgi:nucleoside-diphosphate-sugar epimerase
LYVDAFPLFMGWYPSSSTVYLPSDGPVAFTLREELGEATARLMVRGGFDREIVLLTAQETVTFSEIVDLINETTGRKVQFKIVSPDEFVRVKRDDEGGKAEGFFKALISWYEGISKGETCTIDPLMADLLGRDPVSPREAIRGFLTRDRDYKWHQNYANSG